MMIWRMRMRICERIACRNALFVHDGRHLWFNTYTPDEASRTHHAHPRTKPTPTHLHSTTFGHHDPDDHIPPPTTFSLLDDIFSIQRGVGHRWVSSHGSHVCINGIGTAFLLCIYSRFFPLFSHFHLLSPYKHRRWCFMAIKLGHSGNSIYQWHSSCPRTRDLRALF
jgi:hypothetical protein